VAGWSKPQEEDQSCLGKYAREKKGKFLMNHLFRFGTFLYSMKLLTAFMQNGPAIFLFAFFSDDNAGIEGERE